MIEFTRQFDIAWALTDLHLSALTEDDFLWQPTDVAWTMHREPSGRWRPDWAGEEPDPVPVPTIGWISWHILFWWTAALAALADRPVPAPTEIAWPGPTDTVSAIRSLRERWLELLSSLTTSGLAAPCAFPWGADADRTVADTVLWLNIELTKNGSEIGLLRMLRATS